MFQLAPQGIRGPVCPDLPPTLLPHAVATAAPPRERARSLLLASLVYLALVGSGILLGRMTGAVSGPARSAPRTAPLIWEIPPATPVRILLPARAPSSPASGAIPTGSSRVSRMDAPPEPGLTGLRPVEPSLVLPSGPAVAQAGPGLPSLADPGKGGASRVLTLDRNSVQVLRQVTPAYPPLARMAHVQGVVVLLMTIDARGVPSTVEVLEGPASLREEALRAARLWRFEPARVDGQAIPASFRLTLHFRLR